MKLSTFTKANGERIAFPPERLLRIEQKGKQCVFVFEDGIEVNMTLSFEEARKQWFAEPEAIK